MPILFALIVLVFLWFVLKPGWAPQPPDTTGWPDKASQMFEQATAKAGQLYQDLRGRLNFRAAPDTRKKTAGASADRQPPSRRKKTRRAPRATAPTRRSK